MKKIIKNLKISALAITAITIMSCDAMAQIDNLANLSPEYIRTGSRNAANDAPDAAVYNPAGTTNLTDGFHLSIGNQSLFRSPSHEYDLGMGSGSQTRSQDGADWLLPNIYGVWKKNNMSLYGGYYISGGGATANYPEGSINTDLISMMAVMGAQGAYQNAKDQYLEASSAYSTMFAGIALNPLKNLSVGLSGRFISAKNTTKAGLTLYSSPIELPDAPLVLDTEESAAGFGLVFSASYLLTKNVTVATRYETNVELDFETETNTDDLGIATDGSKNRRDLPAMLAVGTQIVLSEKVKMMADFNYYFQKGADWGTAYVNGVEKELSELSGNSSLYGIAFEYKFTDKLSASLGSVYTVYDYPEKDEYFTYAGAFETVIDDNISFNTGIKYSFTDKLTLNAGVMHNVWKSDVTVKALNAYPLDVDVTTNNSMTTVALGINMLF